MGLYGRQWVKSNFWNPQGISGGHHCVCRNKTKREYSPRPGLSYPQLYLADCGRDFVLSDLAIPRRIQNRKPLPLKRLKSVLAENNSSHKAILLFEVLAIHRPSNKAQTGRAGIPWPTAVMTILTSVFDIWLLKRQTACKPGSVPRPAAKDGHSSGTPVARRLARPTRAATREHAGRRPCRPMPPPPLFGLAPGGVCRAASVAGGRGALLPHRFTLAGGQNLRRRSILCGTVPGVAPAGR